MVWKLKKSNVTEEPPKQAAANVPPMPAAPLPASAPRHDDLDDDFLNPAGPSEINFDASGEQTQGGESDFYSTRLAAVDDAIAALTKSKQGASHPEEAGETSDAIAPALPTAHGDDDEWSLDAFAPYQPPHGFDIPGGNGLTAGTGASDTIDFSLPGGTSTQSAPVEPAGIGDIEAGALPDSPAISGGALDLSGHNTVDDTEWQLGEAGRMQSNDAVPAEAPGETTLVMSGPGPVSGDLNDLPSLGLHQPAPEAPSLPPAGDNGHAAEDYGAPDAIPLSLSSAHAPIAPAVSGAAPSTAQLIVKLGPFSANYPITTDELIIGRPDPKTGSVPDIAIEWDDAISRRHARVLSINGQAMVEDLGSKNGTYLNDNLLPQNKPVPLKDGDKIHVGERTDITFQE